MSDIVEDDCLECVRLIIAPRMRGRAEQVRACEAKGEQSTVDDATDVS